MKRRFPTGPILLVALWVCALPNFSLMTRWHQGVVVDAFALVSVAQTNARRRRQGFATSSSSSPSRLYLNIGGWFGGRDSSRKKQRHQENDAENLGGVASIVDSMGDLKTAQRVGQLTDALVKELSTTVVEGSAMDGKVKVTFDCQQKPVGVTIEESLMTEGGGMDATALSNAVATAMQDAHTKSIERMDEKMKSLYAELGLAATA